MRTDIIQISSDGDNMEAAMEQAEKIAEFKGLSPRNTRHLRLLTEEAMALMRAITGDVEGAFWIEDDGGSFELHLKVNTLMDYAKKEQLLSTATSGKNEATRSFMGRILSFFDPVGGMPMVYEPFMAGGVPMALDNLSWSMVDYREQVRQGNEQGSEEAGEAWDELEKSVMAHMADDVKVSIKGNIVEMIILKKMQ